MATFFKKLGSTISTTVGKLFGSKPPSTNVAPKRGSSSPPPGDLENKLREIRAKWAQWEESVRTGVRETYEDVFKGMPQSEPRFTMPPPEPRLETVDEAQWYDLISSNVDRIRWGEADRVLQVIFKDGSLYSFDGVEPEVFLGYLRTHSPGQYHWNVIRAGGYSYRKLSGGQTVREPAADRFSGTPFAIPEEIEAVQVKAGRLPPNSGTVAKGFAPPPPAFKSVVK